MQTMTRHPHIAKELETAEVNQLSELRTQEMLPEMDRVETSEEDNVVYSDVVIAPIK